MIQLIIRKFVKDYENITDSTVRSSYVVLSGTLGILCNTVLSITKLIIGFLLNSIAVMSDGFNNFTDLGASLSAIVGGKLSNRPPDDEHPNGHGRYEYLASLIVAAMIFVVGFKLLFASYEKLIHPEAVDFNILSLILMILSVSVKVWMWSYNKYIGTKINSNLNMAVATDSRNDVITTSLVIATMIAGQFTTFNLDAIGGLLISLFILYGGWGIVKDTIDLLLGPAPDPEVVEKVTEMVRAGEHVVGAHDLVMHDYGPSHTFASIHADIPENMNLAEVHASMTALENKINEETGINIVVYPDPIKAKVQKMEKVEKVRDMDLMQVSKSIG